MAGKNLHLDALVETEAAQMGRPFAGIVQGNHPVADAAGALVEAECLQRRHRKVQLRLSLKEAAGQALVPSLEVSGS
jgi:hypothetical protein